MRGIPETMVCGILVFMGSFGLLLQELRSQASEPGSSYPSRGTSVSWGAARWLTKLRGRRPCRKGMPAEMPMQQCTSISILQRRQTLSAPKDQGLSSGIGV